MKSKKIILDTNLWISFLITKRYRLLDDFLFEGKIWLIFSEELMEEFLLVVRRPKFKKYFSDKNISELLRLFVKYGKLVSVISSVDKCRDPKDNFLLSLAYDSKADYLVTGDEDLLILEKMGKTKIVSWAEFVKEIG